MKKRKRGGDFLPVPYFVSYFVTPKVKRKMEIDFLFAKEVKS